MIRTVDMSNWNSPYDLYIFDWPQISGGWEKMKAEGLAGGSLMGNALGLGENEEPPGGGDWASYQVCDFSQGDLVLQVQAALGVEQTGVFDEETCSAWHEEFGEVPTPFSLQDTLPVDCDSLVMPACALKEEPRLSSNAVIIGAGIGLAAAAYLMFMK